MSKRNKKNRFSNCGGNTVNQKQWTQFLHLNAGVLEYDKYQRDLKMPVVDKIIKEYDKHLVNPLKVSKRDGHYYVFDGQHTLEAHRKMNGGNDFMIACAVHYGLTYEEEARLFALQNGAATAVGNTYKVHALEEAKDEHTLQFLAATRESGFDIEPGKRTNRNGCIAAITKAQYCYKKLGDEAYRNMLTLIKETWAGEKWSVSQNILAGMCMFMLTYGDEYNKKRFVRDLGNAAEKDIIRASGEYFSMSIPYRYAMAIVTLYNRKGGKGTVDLRKLTLKMIESEDGEE